MAYKIGIRLEPYYKVKDFSSNVLIIKFFFICPILVPYTILLHDYFITHETCLSDCGLYSC